MDGTLLRDRFEHGEAQIQQPTGRGVYWGGGQWAVQGGGGRRPERRERRRSKRIAIKSSFLVVGANLGSLHGLGPTEEAGRDHLPIDEARQMQQLQKEQIDSRKRQKVIPKRKEISLPCSNSSNKRHEEQQQPEGTLAKAEPQPEDRRARAATKSHSTKDRQGLNLPALVGFS